MSEPKQVTPHNTPMAVEKSAQSFASTEKRSVVVSMKSYKDCSATNGVEDTNNPHRGIQSPQNGEFSGTSKGPNSASEKVKENGRSNIQNTSAVHPPIIDDSLISDDNEGFPLISAVFSLAGNPAKDKNGNIAFAEESNSEITISPNSEDPSDVRPAIQVSKIQSNNSKESYVIRGKSPQRAVTTGSQQSRSDSKVPRVVDDNNGFEISTSEASLVTKEQNAVSALATAVSTSTLASAIPNVPGNPSIKTAKTQTPGGVSQLVKLVNSVPVSSPQLLPLSTISGAAATRTRLAMSLPHSPASPVKPVTQPSRQLIIKQGEGSAPFVLNLSPGEPVPKAILLQGSEGKPATIVRLTEGPSSTPEKLLLPVPATVALAPPKGKKIVFVNKLPNKVGGHIPIAPNPHKPAVTSAPGMSTVYLQVPRTVISSCRSNSGANAAVPVLRTVPTSSNLISAARSPQGTNDGLTTPSTAAPTPKMSPSEQTGLSSSEESSRGLSPQEARIQRLKELLKQQEDAVDRLREKRRIEIEQVRDQSLSSKSENENGPVPPERKPLTEQKRPTSPFVVPLPPKKLKLEVASKTKLPKTSDTNLPEAGKAFIPNGDDKTFVQLIGLENVVNNIK